MAEARGFRNSSSCGVENKLYVAGDHVDSEED